MASAAQAENVAETVPVQLTRMEGDLKLILFQITDVSRRTGSLEVQMAESQLETQQLQSDFKAAEKERATEARVRVDTAVALKEQDADRVAKAKQAVDQSAMQSASIWGPYKNLFVILGVLAAVASAYAAFKYGNYPVH